MKKKKNNFDLDFENNDSELSDGASSIQGEEADIGELTKAERKMLRAAKKKGVDRSTLDPYDKSDIAEAKRYAKKNIQKVIFVAITVIMLLAIIITVAVLLILKLNDGPSTANYQVTVGTEDPYELNYKKSNEHGQFYFDLKSIAKYAGLLVSGSDEKMKFTCEDDTYVRLSDDSSVAVVNGETVKVGGKAHVTSPSADGEGECLVPFSFVEKLFSYKKNDKAVGLRVKLNSKNELTIRRMEYASGGYLPISFSPSCFDYADSMLLKADELPNASKEELLAICTPKLTLVNKSHPLKEENITSEGLVSLRSLGCPFDGTDEDFDENSKKDFFDPTAALALIAMITEANTHLEGGNKILVSSAFRSFSYQEGIHNDYITQYMLEQGVNRNEAEEKTLLLSAPAGMSEHHLGLCVDFVREGRRVLDETFEETEAFEWLSKNAHRYGFILRYPKDKTEVTKYSYEPWHYRFVGVEAATVIYEDDITLEEFLAILN